MGESKGGVMRKNITIGVIQLDTQNDKAKNLEAIAGFIGEAKEKGASLVALPEMANFIGRGFRDEAEELATGVTFKHLSALAKKHQLWIHGGSIYEINPKDPAKPFNSTMLINPDGALVSVYRKIHPFDVELKEGPSYRESDQISVGHEIVTVDAGVVGHLGFSICYDLRFGELFRLMALQGAEILFVPANFVLNTGKDHWEALLRARAIENGCYVVAPAQCGVKPAFTAYGKSLVVDPWGNVIAKAPDKPGVILAEIDFAYLESVRNQVMTLPNRRDDLYELALKKR